MDEIYYQFELLGQQHSLNYEDTLTLLADHAIGQPFDYSVRFLLGAMLTVRSKQFGDMARLGLKVEPLGRERFEARLTHAIDIGALTPEQGLTTFSHLSEPIDYTASRSPNSTPVASFAARPALLRTHHVVALPHGRVCVSHFGQAVFDHTERYISGVCYADGILMALADQALLPPLQVFDGTVVALCSLWGDGYFHWIHEILPKLLLIERAGYALDQIEVFLVRTRVPALMEFLARLGIPDSRVVEWQAVQHVRARRLIAVSTLERYDYAQSPTGIALEPWVSRIVHDRFSLPRAPGRRRIYIDRDKAKFRKVINGAEVKRVLAEFDFEFFALEDLSLAQKQELFASADMVAGPCGAGFANLVLCHPGTRVLIIYLQGFETNSFWTLCNNNQLEHYHLVTEPSSRYYPSEQDNTINENFLVDIAALRATLAFMVADS